MHIEQGQKLEQRFLIAHDPMKDGRTFTTDVLFPNVLEGDADLWGIDEGAATLLKGFVLAMKPTTILETGTHRGRSTRALAEGVSENGVGHIWTVDMDDYGLMESGALREHEKALVTQVVGRTPEVLHKEPLEGLTGIDFAFLDGDHSAEGIEAEIAFVEERRAAECIVLVDNSRDPGWPDEKALFENYPKENAVSLPTMCGMHLIHLSD